MTEAESTSTREYQREPPAGGTGRAYGKVILLGEHAVVYGVPALAAPIDLGVTARATQAASTNLSVNGQAVLGEHDLTQALHAILRHLDAPHMQVHLQLDLPAGCGLGASAAMGVAIAHALFESLGQAPTDEVVLAAAECWERVFHGTPSGVDAAAALGRGILRYKRGEPYHLLAPERPLVLALAIADPPASTREMVSSVAKLKARRPEVVERTLAGIHSLVNNAELCIEAGDVTGLGSLMNYNQMLLSGLMLSSENIERACAAARAAGALGAKLTGAGGGGCVVALADEDPASILKAWQDEGFECFTAAVVGSGGDSTHD